jgi:ABC-type branched-subunit amino acid transport system ATPase component
VKLGVRNFRNLRDCAVEIDALTCFVGANGSGKTNLLRAMDLLQRLFTDARENIAAGRPGRPRAPAARRRMAQAAARGPLIRGSRPV